MRRQLALEVAHGKIGEQEFLAAMRRLKEERAGVDEMLPSGPGISATEAVDYIRQFAATWAKAKLASRAALVQSVYEEIVVRGEEFVKVRLTQDAYAHGFALALPAQVSVPLLPGRGRPREIYVNGAPDRIRTCDLRLRRPTLYPLSYRRARPDHTGRAWLELQLLVRRSLAAVRQARIWWPRRL